MSDVMTKPHQLIASDRVEGTAVRRPNGDMIGHIERLMIDKVSGKVSYAILSFGGFLGGFVYDIAGSYNPALIGAAGALVVAVMLVNLLGPYTYPVRRDIEPLLVGRPATP